MLVSPLHHFYFVFWNIWIIRLLTFLNGCNGHLSATYQVLKIWFFHLSYRSTSMQLLLINSEIRRTRNRSSLKQKLGLILNKVIHRSRSCILVGGIKILNIALWPLTLTRVDFCHVPISVSRVRGTSSIAAKEVVLASSLIQFSIMRYEATISSVKAALTF